MTEQKTDVSYRPDLQGFADTLSASSGVIQEFFISQTVNTIATALARRKQALQDRIKLNNEKDLKLCQAVVMADAQAFITDNGLDRAFGINTDKDPCYDFLKGVVAEGLLLESSRGRKLGGLLDRFIDGFGSASIDNAYVFQKKRNKDFARDGRGSCEKRADEIRYLTLHDLFPFLIKQLSEGQNFFPADKATISQWKARKRRFDKLPE